MIKNNRFLPKNWVLKAVVVAVTAIMAWEMYEIGVQCVFLRMTGIPCPGCGITRATAALLSGRVHEAFVYYPAYGALPILFLYFMYDGKVFSHKGLNRAVLIICATVIALFYVIKLLKL